MKVSVEFSIEDTEEKMLLPGDLVLGDRNSKSGEFVNRQDATIDEYVTSEYVFTGIHHNGQS